MLTRLRSGFVLVAALAALAGCGGSSTAASSNPSGDGSTPGTTPVIQGIATPSSVSVVTATNSE